MMIKSVLKITIELLVIQNEVEQDPSATRLLNAVQSEILALPNQAKSFLRREQPSDEEIVTIQKQVSRFVQTKDRYTSLTSMLLKSQSFHSICQSTPEERVTVVELPRTKHKKPYIPVLNYESTKNHHSMKEEDFYPLSVSHQFPFVGLARLNMDGPGDEDFRPHVGMDIVTFDDYNPRLYSNQQEFIDVFRESFTKWEWSLIENEEMFRLNEFYVRWAMKEAYTKALGLGMGIDFTSFEMKVDPPGSEDQQSFLWRYISSQADGCYIPGYIKHLNDKKTESWDFFFLPLHDQKSPGEATEFKGCMCVCVGEFSGHTIPSPRFQTVVHWTDLQSLIRWHQPTAALL